MLGSLIGTAQLKSRQVFLPFVKNWYELFFNYNLLAVNKWRVGRKTWTVFVKMPSRNRQWGGLVNKCFFLSRSTVRFISLKQPDWPFSVLPFFQGLPAGYKNELFDCGSRPWDHYSLFKVFCLNFFSGLLSVSVDSMYLYRSLVIILMATIFPDGNTYICMVNPER